MVDLGLEGNALKQGRWVRHGFSLARPIAGACYTPPMDALALYTQGCYWEALLLARRQAEVRAAALSLLALGQVAEAQTLLESWQPQESVAQAERLALLGFAAFRRGDPATYRRWALAAAQQAQTPLTLYHLGLSLPPADGLLALQAALDRCEGPPEEQARLAYALARTYRRLGRLAEALSYASRAVLQAPEQPHYRLEELTLLALAGEEPLPALERSLPPLLAHAAPGVRYYALWLSLLLQGMQGQESPELLEALLRQNSSPHLPYDLPLLVLLFRHHPSARPLLSRWLRAAAAGSSPDPLPQALQSLAQGLWHYPRPEARPLLEAALPTLQTEWAEEALRAAAHLAALKGVPLPAPYRRMAQALRPEARALFLPPELPPPATPYLRTLGAAYLEGFPALRPRTWNSSPCCWPTPKASRARPWPGPSTPCPTPRPSKASSAACVSRASKSSPAPTGFVPPSRPTS
ncbi:putative uncharacterized protein [Meiothermus ruber H328]|nr:putative uncharacterized protein [Meiothermus ruber H328]